MEHMGEQDQIAILDVLPEEWVEAVNKLSAKVGEDGLYVKLLFGVVPWADTNS